MSHVWPSTLPFLSIDGLQPEKVLEVLYAVRELNAVRGRFAAPLLSSMASEIEALSERARDIGAAGSAKEVGRRLATQTTNWTPGLFVGGGVAVRLADRAGRPYLPEDNYGIERSFRLPKGHARHVHCRAHAGARWCHEAPRCCRHSTPSRSTRHPSPMTICVPF